MRDKLTGVRSVGRKFRLIAACAVLTAPLCMAATWSQQQELTAADGRAGDGLGQSVAENGDTAVIGAPYKSGTEGAAYVYVRSVNGWVQQQKLTPPDGAAGDNFGLAVAIEGDTIVVGAPSKQIGLNGQQGAAYIFVRNGGAWTFAQRLVNSTGVAQDLFGVSVAISGNTMLIGESQAGHSGNGAAFVFVNTGAWSQQQILTASDGAASDEFGYSVSLSGNTAAVGAPGKKIGPNSGQGSAYVFVRSGNSWSQQQELTASNGVANDEFGISVAVNADTAVVGALAKKIGANSLQGTAYVFVRTAGSWSQQQQLTASNGAAQDLFGCSVSIDADTVLIGAFGKKVGSNSFEGAAFVFSRKGTFWTQQQMLTSSDGASGDEFGISVSVNGITAVAGAGARHSNQGAAYVFASSYADSYQVGYAANLVAGDSLVDLTNAGSRNGYDPAGGICANVYVFAADQQMIACCSCYLTPNHLKSLSVQQDLVSNTLTPGAPTAVTVAVLATDPIDGTTCDAGAANTGGPERGLRAWGTTLHLASGGYQTTEVAFQKADLSSSELNKLGTYCGFIQANGSSYGICNSCRTGPMGSARN